MTKIFKCINQSEAKAITIKDGGQTQRCSVILKELGGQYENEYLCTLYGNAATANYNDSLVVAKLSFRTHNHEGVTYQDINIQEIQKLIQL